jgi:hypothetical protein
MITSVQKEIYFGKTLLPVWKVYGTGKLGAKASPEYLQSGKKFTSDTYETLQKQATKSTVFAVRTTNLTNYYVFLAHMLMGVSNEGVKEYTELRIGSNAGPSTFSFTVEGTGVINEDQLVKKYK